MDPPKSKKMQIRRKRVEDVVPTRSSPRFAHKSTLLSDKIRETCISAAVTPLKRSTSEQNEVRQCCTARNYNLELLSVLLCLYLSNIEIVLILYAYCTSLLLLQLQYFSLNLVMPVYCTSLFC